MMKDKIMDYFVGAFREMSKEKLEVVKKNAHEQLDKELDDALLKVSLMLEHTLQLEDLKDRIIITLRKDTRS